MGTPFWDIYMKLFGHQSDAVIGQLCTYTCLYTVYTNAYEYDL